MSLLEQVGGIRQSPKIPSNLNHTGKEVFNPSWFVFSNLLLHLFRNFLCITDSTAPMKWLCLVSTHSPFKLDARHIQKSADSGPKTLLVPFPFPIARSTSHNPFLKSWLMSPISPQECGHYLNIKHSWTPFFFSLMKFQCLLPIYALDSWVTLSWELLSLFLILEQAIVSHIISLNCAQLPFANI